MAAISSLMGRKTVAIIGAGPSGLISAAVALKAGLSPVIYESKPGVGGLWNREHGLTWNSLRTNLSKFTCSFSEFPWAPDADIFPSRACMHAYLTEFAVKENLTPLIRFDTRVKTITRCDAGSQVRWKVDTSAPAASNSEVFDFVIVASGIFSVPKVPAELQNLSQCKVIHSAEYRSPDAFHGKNVAVVGSAFSACEIAAELATTCQTVTVVTPKPCWVLPRLLPTGPGSSIPTDLVFYSRAKRFHADEIFIRSPDENHKVTELLAKLCREQADPSHPLHIDPHSTEPPFIAISDGFLDLVRSGRIKIAQGRLLSISTNGSLELDTGSPAPPPVDAVVLCTGFLPDLSFLDASTRSTISLEPSNSFQPLLLYNSMFHPDLPHMAFVGLYRGPYFAVLELQARLAVGVFTGRTTLPPRDVMLRGIDTEREIRGHVPLSQFPHGDYVGFADRLAAAAGVLPPWTEVERDDPILYRQLRHGPVISAHYRLFGPDSSPALARLQIDAACAAAGVHTVDSAAKESVGKDPTQPALLPGVDTDSAQPNATGGGTSTPERIFHALCGSTWSFIRTIDDTLNAAGSVEVSGTAKFEPTDPDQLLLLYSEEGTMKMKSGVSLSVNRQYIYTLAGGELSVFFARGGVQEGLFMTLKFDEVETETKPSSALQSVPVTGSDPRLGLIKGTGSHLCSQDMYRGVHEFQFSDGNGGDWTTRCERLVITYKVDGPRKDYTSTTVYLRTQNE